MYRCVFGLLLWILATSSPLSTAQAQAQAQRSRLEIKHSDDVCSEISAEECCAQMLEIALFRSTGGHVPRAAKGPLRLSCRADTRTIPDNACKLIAMGRGLSAQDAAEACAPAGLAKRCTGDAACKQCVEDLSRLEWKGAARACYALTYQPKGGSSGARVVTLGRRAR
jgi:hypothetical protein